MNNKENYPTWLVSLDIAKELKEIGFNEPCLVTYHEVFDEEMIFISFEGDDYCYYYAELSECSQRTNSEMGKDILETGKHYSYACSIPVWEQALAWFRARGYKITFKDINIGTQCAFYHLDIKEGHTFSHFAKKYEKAREALVMKLIEVHKEFGNNIKRK
ncbi:hypothetical protein [Capnocytophaga sputigena]|uniref:hypothetical protein n=1 Tax=Capnocytophaga sputigena TaxID=1019 RepID=UPI000F6C957F|nr:hypothetical protein [Capnocytophaga sputigena]VEI52644.1 Uncharacterised protein [Capnocytophaga sputigena]